MSAKRIPWNGKPGPRLAKLIESGNAYVDEFDSVTLIASDNEELLGGSLSTKAYANAIEEFLANYPNPTDW